MSITASFLASLYLFNSQTVLNPKFVTASKRVSIRLRGPAEYIDLIQGKPFDGSRCQLKLGV